MRRRWITVASVALATAAWVGVVVFFRREGATWDAAWLDVTIYREGAVALLAGDDVYDGRYGFSGDGLPFTYPPFALLAFVPVALVTEPVAVTAAAVGNALLLTVCVRWCAGYALPGVRVPWAPVVLSAGVFAVFVEPVRTTIGLGQINLLILALVLGVDARATRWAGVGAGIGAALKVTPALLVAAQLVRGDVRALLRGVAAFLLCTAIAAFVAWDETVTYFGELLWQSDRPGPLAYVGNQSLRGMVARMGAGGVLWLVLAVGAVVLGAVAVRRHRADPWAALTAAAVTGLLVSPVSWNHHWVWVLPALAVGIRFLPAAPWLAGTSGLLVLSTAVLAGPGTFLDVSWLAHLWPFPAENAYVLLGALWLVTLALIPAQPGEHDIGAGWGDVARGARADVGQPPLP